MSDEVWTVGKLLTWVSEKFSSCSLPKPRLEAELLLGHALGKTRVELYLQHEQPLTEQEREPIRQALRRRLAGEPMAYITGQRGFWSVSVQVEPGVLIPRPETELLIELALHRFNRKEPLRFLDVGTGSGCISQALLEEFPLASGRALDRSAKALAVASKNLAKFGEQRIALQQSDLYAGVPEKEIFDLVVANLPYIPTSELGGLMKEVREFEPREALDGGEDGLVLVRRALEGLPAVLAPQGFACFEIGYNQAESLLKFAADRQLPFDFSAEKDYSGILRVICCARPGSLPKPLR